MGTYGNGKGDKQGQATRGGGSHRAASASTQRRIRRAHRGTVEVADWASANAEVLLACVEKVTSTGAAIRLGYTRDGGAFAIGILDGDEKHTEYVRPSEDIDLYLRDLAEDYAEPVGTPAGSGLAD